MTENDARLLDRILLQFRIFYTEDLALSDKEKFERMRKRLERRRNREGASFPRLLIDSKQESGPRSVRYFIDLLARFVNRGGFGVEYDQRRIREIKRILEHFEKLLSEKAASL